MATQTNTIEKAWEDLSPDEKIERRFAAWLDTSRIKFSTVEAKADYEARITRLTDAIRLKKTPDRVPVTPSLGEFAAAYCGYTQQDMMYDADKAIDASARCTLDFKTDTQIGAGGGGGMMWELLDDKLYSWAGHGLDANSGKQFHEGEYMKADEYDAFIQDPRGYWWGTYIPRVEGALAPLARLMPSTQMVERPERVNWSLYGLPEVKSALGKLIQAGEEALAWQAKMAPAGRRLSELGFPTMGGGTSRASFDSIGDAMRGTSGIMTDIYRRPQKLLQAIERITPINITAGLAGARLGGFPSVGFALHKGSDPFLSDEQFKTFYWPSLRQTILAFIEEGCVVGLGCQGCWNSRLEYLADLPKGKIIFNLGTTDRARAKEVLGDRACLRGGVPAALMQVGTPEETEAYCKKLIDTVGKGGGYILSMDSGMNRTSKVENVRALIKCAKEYGVYQ